MNILKPLAPADETLIQFLKMGSDLVNRKSNAELEMRSMPSSQNLLLDDDLCIGAITLRARDHKGLAMFYQLVLGLELMDNDLNVITLGRNNKPLIIIKNGQVLAEKNKYAPGLFNFGFVYENDSMLASVLTRVMYYHPELFRGATHNGVSTNFYLEDPEGNGIKLYCDRKLNTWKWLGNTIQINPQPIDPNEYLKYHFNEKIDEQWKRIPVRIGQVHLQVGAMSKAREFFGELFGLNTTMSLPSVNFFSANGYHQHFAVNTWNSRGTQPYITQGVEEIQVLIGDETYLSAIKRKLEDSDIKNWVDKQGRFIIVDPGTLIRFEVKLIPSVQTIVQGEN